MRFCITLSVKDELMVLTGSSSVKELEEDGFTAPNVSGSSRERYLYVYLYRQHAYIATIKSR